MRIFSFSLVFFGDIMLNSQLAKITESEKIEWNITELTTNHNFTTVKCNSKMIFRYGYDSENLKLYVTFRSKNRDTYSYLRVPKEIFENMNIAFSKGNFLNTYVKKHFNYEKRIDLPPL